MGFAVAFRLSTMAGLQRRWMIGAASMSAVNARVVIRPFRFGSSGPSLQAMSLKSFRIFYRRLPIVGALCALVHVTPALAQEAFAGAYAHAVDTPLTFDTGEGGADLQLGYRFAPSETLRFLGKPAPYLIASVNTDGDTNFAGAGLSWKLGSGRLYVRPEVGLVIHDGQPGE